MSDRTECHCVALLEELLTMQLPNNSKAKKKTRRSLDSSLTCSSSSALAAKQKYRNA